MRVRLKRLLQLSLPSHSWSLGLEHSLLLEARGVLFRADGLYGSDLVPCRASVLIVGVYN